MNSFQIRIKDIKDEIFIPKYYNPLIKNKLFSLKKNHKLISIFSLIEEKKIEVSTGHEIGKMAYGTGDIPFVRTSDIVNWEIKTIPKQGISQDMYEDYAEKEDVQAGDILLVRDGTYLIGTTSIITSIDLPMLFQSHILKFRVIDPSLSPLLFFLALNTEVVQQQIRSIQFTADTIDTIGNRYKELVLPFPKDADFCNSLVKLTKNALKDRSKYKLAIKQMPTLIENCLSNNCSGPIRDFFSESMDELQAVQDTTTAEFGKYVSFNIPISDIRSNIFLPKYYDINMKHDLECLSINCDLISMKELCDSDEISMFTGHEIGKMAYGTGDIPFVRTSDFSNWEIKTDPKQGVSKDIYEQYCEKEDVAANDIFIVRDGTYLVGTSCMISESDLPLLYCGGLIKIRCNNSSRIDHNLLFALLNSYIVKRQIRTKQFTRDVIDTLGQRLSEVVLPIPKSEKVRSEISNAIKHIIFKRIESRNEIYNLAKKMTADDW